MRINSYRIPALAWLVWLCVGASTTGLANTAVAPVPRDAKWLERHEQFVSRAKQDDPDVLFLGDSITDYWERADKKKGGSEIWSRDFAGRRVLNFGIAADRTQHLLWRLQHGEIDGIHPKVVMLLIGTNNTGLENDNLTPRSTPEETVEGITAIVRLLREKLPESRLLLLALFPRGEPMDPRRKQVAQINARISQLHDGQFIHYLDFGPAFLLPDGTIAPELMPDLLHPSEKGYEIWSRSIKEPLAKLLSAGSAVAESERIPLVDLSSDVSRRVVIDREPGQYLGHTSTLLLEDGATMLLVYPKGHARGPIVYRRSSDQGLTWSDRLPTPSSWSTSVEVPTLFRTVDAQGKKRVVMFSGTGAGNRSLTVRMAISENDGGTWSELRSVGDFGGIAAMSSMIRLADGGYMAFFHDDMKNLDPGETIAGKRAGVLKTISRDGGLSWSRPEIIATHSRAFLCEPGALRSPDGRQIALLLRENSRQFHSFVIFSNDEGASWTAPRELPLALTGDRHVAKYTLDGRLFIAFRDTGRGSPTYGDWVGWVGTYKDILAGHSGQYRVRLMHNTKTIDCGYSGVEVLADGTVVATTYGHWDSNEAPYIVNVRFKLAELDRKLSAGTN